MADNGEGDYLRGSEALDKATLDLWQCGANLLDAAIDCEDIDELVAKFSIKSPIERLGELLVAQVECRLCHLDLIAFGDANDRKVESVETPSFLADFCIELESPES